MAKEKSDDKEERRREKKERKEKQKLVRTNGVRKPESDNPAKINVPTAATEGLDVTTELLKSLDSNRSGSIEVKDDENIQTKVYTAPLIGALVPFANPLADDKQQKKVLKTVKKAAKNKTVKRGVKEVVKALRKSPLANASESNEPTAVIVIAADISPMDVISHIPVLCEDHGVPYIFVPSRVELGAAGNTKRPTSVVMINRTKTVKKKEGEERDEDEWAEVYKDLVKLITKASKSVKI